MSMSFLFFNSGFGQCLGKSKGSRALSRVERFVTAPYQQEKREETGAIDESKISINIVEDESVCSQIEGILTNDIKINNNLDNPDLAKYFYETTNYYYAFWAPKPEFDGIPKTGPKLLFVVIKKDLSEHWKYYL